MGRALFGCAGDRSAAPVRLEGRARSAPLAALTAGAESVGWKTRPRRTIDRFSRSPRVKQRWWLSVRILVARRAAAWDRCCSATSDGGDSNGTSRAARARPRAVCRGVSVRAGAARLPAGGGIRAGGGARASGARGAAAPRVRARGLGRGGGLHLLRP